MKIGRYEVRGLLGRGGMGAVYKVAQPVTGRIAALKLLRPADILEDHVGLESLAAKFEKEATMMASLDHPNIASVWDYDTAYVAGATRPFFVMEYYCLNLGMLMGEIYRVEAPTRRLPLERAVSYALQTLDALDRMHHAGVVHRDVKPFNIMITGHDEVKLIDFGLSRLRGETPGMEPGNVKVGSPYYAPPEQEHDPDGVDGRADLYPVGIMLYRMLTGVLPNDEELLAQHGGTIPAASSYSEDLDDAWDAFFIRATAPDPADRFADARAMAAELARLRDRWRARIRSVCSLLDDEGIVSPPCVADALRAEPCKAGVGSARERFGLDELWRPRCMGRPSQVVGQLADKGDGTVLDAASRRMWQKQGSDYPLTWPEAGDYVAWLNETAYAGHSDWRLPTVDELATIMEEPPMLGGYCMASVFRDGAENASGSGSVHDAARDSLWTCDRKSYMAAWFVSTTMGFVGWQDDTCRFGVRAVRTVA
ncbi:DUF1566 domain-containing protein [Desulfovibrio subterraneus]|jgi:serine/threonine-protein kinase|uniref:protein kinase domain-containing protein n=1 Tax=Desulfovibrio subterraneus TaxID=2718620 RepID=UPI0022B8FD1B|nr:DUF1566 domain-containing protein [Desulfovibrio subterraneus]WBF66856.1 DUF1566 domain-containing protein [Desulfovibrio subterraneus]